MIEKYFSINNTENYEETYKMYLKGTMNGHYAFIIICNTFTQFVINKLYKSDDERQKLNDFQKGPTQLFTAIHLNVIRIFPASTT